MHVNKNEVALFFLKQRKLIIWRQAYTKLNQGLWYSQTGCQFTRRLSLIWLQTRYKSFWKLRILFIFWLPAGIFCKNPVILNSFLKSGGSGRFLSQKTFCMCRNHVIISGRKKGKFAPPKKHLSQHVVGKRLTVQVR